MLSVTPSIAARRSASRRAFAVLGAVMVAFATLVSTAPQASAANYLYWSYWQQTAGKWAFSSVGADKATPSDGAVEGWRWAIDDGSGSRPPRVLPTFEQLCASTPADPTAAAHTATAIIVRDMNCFKTRFRSGIGNVGFYRRDACAAAGRGQSAAGRAARRRGRC